MFSNKIDFEFLDRKFRHLTFEIECQMENFIT